MRTCSVVLLFVLIYAARGVEFDRKVCRDGISGVEEYDLQPNVPAYVSMTSGCILNLKATDTASDTEFVIIQAHGLKELTMSQAIKLTINNHINGTDVGLQSWIQSGIQTSAVYLSNPNHNRTVNVLLLLVEYKDTDPVPGGCSMEFPLPTSPFMITSFNYTVVNFEYQLASPPVMNPSCESKQVEYEVYHFYAPEGDMSEITYFDSIVKMSTVESIQKYGHQVNVPTIDPVTRVTFSAYDALPSICAVIAKSKQSGGKSAYVPAFMYTCNSGSGGTCHPINTAFSHACCIAMFIMGIMIAFLGHFHLKTSVGVFLVWLFPFGIGAITGIPAHGVIQELMHIHITIGIFGWCIFLFQCIFFSVLVIVLWDSFGMGFFFAMMLMSTPFGDLGVFKSDVNFWLIFVAAIVLVPSGFLFMKTMGSTISCAIVGSMSFVLAIDFYIGASLKYLLINTVRRMYVHEFDRAILDVPFQMKDTILVVVWIVMVILSAVVQMLIARHASGDHEVVHTGDDDERSPLLPERPSYGAVEEIESPVADQNARLLL